MKYLLSIAIVPFLLLGVSNFEQGNKDKNQNSNKGGKPDKVEIRNSDDNHQGKEKKGGGDDYKQKGNQSKKEMKHFENEKGAKSKNHKHDWKEEDKWNDGRWDDQRFDARMKKLKGYKKSNWVNSTYYNNVAWFNGNDYYTAKGPKGNKKVSICHKPNGSDYPVMISVSENAVNAHLKHGDYLGQCKDYDRSRYSDNYWNTRDNYYTQYTQTTETLSFGEQLLALAIDKLLNARTTMAPLRATLQEDELRRKEAAIINLQNDVYNLQNSLARSNEQVGMQVNLNF